MDKSTYTQGKEYTATTITPAEMIKEGQLVLDRKTGQAYDPKIKFDEMMAREDIQAVFKRLAVR